jgi:hypothetical protein
VFLDFIHRLVSQEQTKLKIIIDSRQKNQFPKRCVIVSWMLLVCVPLCVCVCFVLIFWPLCVLWFVSSCVTNCHLCFFWLLVSWCVCMCAALGFYAILVFPRFFVCCDLCSGCVIYCHACFTGFKVLCVRPGRLLCGL